MLKDTGENYLDKVLLGGIVLTLLGIAVFFGASPRGMRPDAPGEAWPLALPLVAAGLSLLGLNRYRNR